MSRIKKEEDIIPDKSGKRHKKVIIITMICISLIICLFITYIANQILPLYLIKKSMGDKGKCHFELRCHISEDINKYMPYLDYMGVTVERVTFKMDKDGHKYHGKVYINDSDKIALEFYRNDDNTVINVSELVSYIAYENSDILPDKLVDIANADKDIYMTTEAIGELVGDNSDISIEDEILKIIDIKGKPSAGVIKKHMFTDNKNMHGLEFASGTSATIKLYSSIGIFNGGQNTIIGVRSNRDNIDDFIIKYKSDRHLKVEMPKKTISKLEVVIAKKLFENLAEELSEKIKEQ